MSQLLEAAFELYPHERKVVIGTVSMAPEDLMQQYRMDRVTVGGPASAEYLKDAFKGSPFRHLTFTTVVVENVDVIMRQFANVETLAFYFPDVVSGSDGASMLRNAAKAIPDLTRLHSVSVHMKDLEAADAIRAFWLVVSERANIQRVSWTCKNWGKFKSEMFPVLVHVSHFSSDCPFIKLVDRQLPALVDYGGTLRCSTVTVATPEAYYTSVNKELVNFLAARARTLEEFSVTPSREDEFESLIQDVRFERLSSFQLHDHKSELLTRFIVRNVVGASNQTVRHFVWNSKLRGDFWTSVRSMLTALEADTTIAHLSLTVDGSYFRRPPWDPKAQLAHSTKLHMPLTSLVLSENFLRDDDTLLLGFPQLTHLTLISETAVTPAPYMPLLAMHPKLESFQFRCDAHCIDAADVRVDDVAHALATLPPTMHSFSWTFRFTTFGETDSVHVLQEKLLAGLAANRGLVCFSCDLFRSTYYEPLKHAKVANEFSQLLDKKNPTLVQLDMRLLLELKDYEDAIRANGALEYVVGCDAARDWTPYTPPGVQQICVQARLRRENRLAVYASCVALIAAEIAVAPQGGVLGRSMLPLMKQISKLANLPYFPGSTRVVMEYAGKLYQRHLNAAPVVIPSSSSSSSSASLRKRKR